MQQRESPIEAADRIDRRRVTGQLDASGREKVTAPTQHGIASGPSQNIWYYSASLEKPATLASSEHGDGTQPTSKTVAAVNDKYRSRSIGCPSPPQ